MATKNEDPTDAIRRTASQYPGVDEGMACTQSSFKIGKKAFLFIGEQGGRYKAMFKLEASKPTAAKLADKQPDCYNVGSTAWVTVRFTADRPIPEKRWQKWLDESYALCVPVEAKNATKRKTQKKAARKKK